MLRLTQRCASGVWGGGAADGEESQRLQARARRSVAIAPMLDIGMTWGCALILAQVFFLDVARSAWRSHCSSCGVVSCTA